MKRYLLALVFLFVGGFAFTQATIAPCEAIGIKTEYDLLVNDLSNINTYGYKGHFDLAINKGQTEPAIVQGRLIKTDIPTDIAVLGNGFLGVNLDNGKIAFTRNGRMTIDSAGELLLLDKYHTGIHVPEDSYRVAITGNGDVFSIKKDEIKVFIGTIIIYKLDAASIMELGNGLYISNRPQIENESRIIQGCLEESSVSVEKTLYRVLYLLEKDEQNEIVNNEYKVFLVKTVLENIIASAYSSNLDWNAMTESIIEVSSFLKSEY